MNLSNLSALSDQKLGEHVYKKCNGQKQECCTEAQIFLCFIKKVLYILYYEYAGAVIRQVSVSLSVKKKCSLATVHPEAQYWMLSVIYSCKITLPS